jgi:hypothetical protein
VRKSSQLAGLALAGVLDEVVVYRITQMKAVSTGELRLKDNTKYRDVRTARAP